MRQSLFVSIFLHAVVVVLAIFGLPEIRKAAIVAEVPMVVEVVPKAQATNIPSTRKLLDKSAKKEIETKNSKPPVTQKPVPVKRTKSSQKSQNTVPIPESLKSKAKIKIEKKQKVKKNIHKKLIKVKPQRKPKPPDRFAMVLRNLEKDLKRTNSKLKKPIKKKPFRETDLISRLSKSLSRRSEEFDSNERVTISERNAMINSVKRRMEPCWNFQAGSKKAQDIIVELEVKLRPNGRVLEASIKNQLDLKTNFERAAGESALRAVLNPDCQPYELPIKRYSIWKDLKLTFNPREMLGR